jgi:hypothetical protein
MQSIAAVLWISSGAGFRDWIAPPTIAPTSAPPTTSPTSAPPTTTVPTPLIVCTVMNLGFNEWTTLGESGKKKDDYREQGVQPFKDGTDLTGYDSGMRKLLLVEAMGLSYELKVLKTYGEVINKTALKECDVGFAPFTVTSGREGQVDFSHPYFPGSVGFMYKLSEIAGGRSITSVSSIISALIATPVLNKRRQHVCHPGDCQRAHPMVP